MEQSAIDRRRFAAMLMTAPIASTACSAAPPRSDARQGGFSYLPGIANPELLVAPTGRAIRVAFAINPGVQVIDTAGPWETFQDTYASLDAERAAFELFTVSESTKPLRASGGLTIVPDFRPSTRRCRM